MTLEEQIEKLRIQMVSSGMKLGFHHPKVQALSQKLDRMLNDWHKIKHQTKCDQVKEEPFFYRVASF